MISHLKNKPSKERIIECINQAAKVEFAFLINGLNCELIGVEADEVIQLIDRKTKALKSKIFGFYDGGKRINQDAGGEDHTKRLQQQHQQQQLQQQQRQDHDNSENTKPSVNHNAYQHQHQKITFDEDF